MAKNTEITLQFKGDSRSIEKSLDNTNKRLKQTTARAKQANKDVTGLGKGFTQAANNVAVFNGQLDPISGRLSAIGTGITRFGVAGLGAAAGLTAFTLSIVKAISAGQDFEQRTLRFNALLKATSYQSGLTTKDLEALANQIGKDTLSNTAEAAEGINALLTFKKVQGDVFKETVKLARDAQVAFGGNMRETVVAFGKALNDPIANLGALSRKGIQFGDVQEENIKRMWEMGDAAGAQNIIIQEMRSQFGGLAAEEAKTLRGSLDGLSHSWDRFWETMGKTETMKGFTAFIDDYVRATTDLIDANVRLHTSEYKLTAATHEKNKAHLAYLKSQKEEEKIQLRLNELKKGGHDTGSVSSTKGYRDAQKELAHQKQISIHYAKQFTEREKLEWKLLTSKRAADAEQAKLDEIGRKKKAIADQADAEDRLNGALEEGKKIAKANAARFEDEIQKNDRKYAEQMIALTTQRDLEVKLADEAGKETADITAKWDTQILLAKTGHQNKLDQINDRAEKRAKAEEMRIKRAATVALNAQRKREKFLTGINAGSSKLKDLEYAYADDVEKLATAEFDKTEFAAHGVETRAEMVSKYVKLLAANYKEDVDAYIKAEEMRIKRAATVALNAQRKADKFLAGIDIGSSKTLELKHAYEDDLKLLQETEFKKIDGTALSLEERAKLVDEYTAKLAANYKEDVDAYVQAEADKKQAAIDSAAEAAGREFKDDVKLAETNRENNIPEFQQFFEVDLNEVTTQQAELERVTAEHLQRIADLNISNEEKIARQKEVAKQYGIEQQENEAKSREKAYGDMWGAINVLGVNGSKKAFAVSKALNIAKIGMDTAAAVTNALKLPPPMNFVAAGIVGAAGLVQMNNVRKQEMPQFHDGINYVPREGSYLLDKGERVLDSRLNSDLTSYLSTKDEGGSGDTNINLAIPDTGSYTATEQWYNDNRQAIMNDLRYSMDRV